MHLLEKMSPALSTRVNSFNFILNERGGVLARRVVAGVGLTRLLIGWPLVRKQW